MAAGVNTTWLAKHFGALRGVVVVAFDARLLWEAWEEPGRPRPPGEGLGARGALRGRRVRPRQGTHRSREEVLGVGGVLLLTHRPRDSRSPGRALRSRCHLTLRAYADRGGRFWLAGTCPFCGARARVKVEPRRVKTLVWRHHRWCPVPTDGSEDL